jgi:hypothetical protein
MVPRVHVMIADGWRGLLETMAPTATAASKKRPTHSLR